MCKKCVNITNKKMCKNFLVTLDQQHILVNISNIYLLISVTSTG